MNGVLKQLARLVYRVSDNICRDLQIGVKRTCEWLDSMESNLDRHDSHRYW